MNSRKILRAAGLTLAGALGLWLFAAVLLVQLVLLVFARRKRPRRILVFAGTLVVVLGLCVWACFPAWTAGA